MMASDLLNDTVKDILTKLVSENKKLHERCDMIISQNSLLIKKVESHENEIKSLKDEIKTLKDIAEVDKSNITEFTTKLNTLNKNKSANNSHLSDYEKENAVKILSANPFNWHVLNYQRLKNYLIINDFSSISMAVNAFYKVGAEHYFHLESESYKYNGEQYIDEFICNVRDINNKYTYKNFKCSEGAKPVDITNSFAWELLHSLCMKAYQLVDKLFICSSIYMKGYLSVDHASRGIHEGRYEGTPYKEKSEHNKNLVLFIAKTLKKYGIDIYTKYRHSYLCDGGGFRQQPVDINIIELLDRMNPNDNFEMPRCIKSILLGGAHQDF